jgi:hypothetical protein
VYLEILDTDSRLAAIRTAATAPPFTALEFPPHLTIIHPRTSKNAAEFWRSDRVQTASAELTIDAIVITAFEDATYKPVARLALR